MAQRHHPVDMRVVRQLVGSEVFGDPVHHRGRAIDGRQNTDEIARTHLAIGTHNAFKSSLLLNRQHRGVDVVATMRVVAVEITKRRVVRVHVGAG